MADQETVERVDASIVRPEAEGIVAGLIQKAYDFQKMIEDGYDNKIANRRSLRDLDQQGLLTEDQSRWLKEFYKPRAANKNPQQPKQNQTFAEKEVESATQLRNRRQRGETQDVPAPTPRRRRATQPVTVTNA